jgi:hypothetical protein
MKKKIFTTGLAIALFLTSGVVNAKEIKGPDKSKESKVLEVLAEGNDVQTKNNYAISPHIHGTCVRCGQWCYTVCAADGEMVILGLTIRCLLRIVKLRFLEAEEPQCAEAVLMSMNNTDIMIAGRFILNVAKGVMMFVPWIYLKTKGKMQLK